MQSPRVPPEANITVTVQVLDGVDKGRVFRALPVPLTIGREEGNLLRLNDERVSRYHAKVLQDGDDLVLTDMESTNGTRVNGHIIQIRRLRFGDRITVGRSLLLFGSDEEIKARKARLADATGTRHACEPGSSGGGLDGPPTLHASDSGSGKGEEQCEFDLNVSQQTDDSETPPPSKSLPLLPEKLTPSQAARIAEIFDFFHQQLTSATEEIEADEEGSKVILSYADWQTVLSVQNLLARYLRAVAEPDSLGQ
jgi:pSer/pThr/pTyr-binding forkhead associated (FHA) protein